jgi:hypothetical protein
MRRTFFHPKRNNQMAFLQKVDSDALVTALVLWSKPTKMKLTATKRIRTSLAVWERHNTDKKGSAWSG